MVGLSNFQTWKLKIQSCTFQLPGWNMLFLKKKKKTNSRNWSIVPFLLFSFCCDLFFHLCMSAACFSSCSCMFPLTGLFSFTAWVSLKFAHSLVKLPNLICSQLEQKNIIVEMEILEVLYINTLNFQMRTLFF